MDRRYINYLGCLESIAGNHQRAMKHYMIASKSKAGNESSLVIKQGFMRGHVTKDEYANTLRTYQKIQDGMNSDTRDKVAYTSPTHRIGN